MQENVHTVLETEILRKLLQISKQLFSAIGFLKWHDHNIWIFLLSEKFCLLLSKYSCLKMISVVWPNISHYPIYCSSLHIKKLIKKIFKIAFIYFEVGSVLCTSEYFLRTIYINCNKFIISFWCLFSYFKYLHITKYKYIFTCNLIFCKYRQISY